MSIEIGRVKASVFGLFLLAGLAAPVVHGAISDGALRVEVITAYNLVVDSNAGTPASYAPRAAYLGVTYHNDGTVPLTDVFAHIGDYKGGTGDTPGIYPSRIHPGLTGPLAGGAFALAHEGGSAGLSDATRYIASIPAGGSVTVYWLISYPHLDIYNVPTWGSSVKPDDDLWLEYDVWATASEGGTPRAVDLTRKVTMRNEISASANKIFPNGANKVPDYYKQVLNQYVPVWTNANADGTVGTRIITDGIWYDLGNVGEGFDNNGDLVPDHNAWMQPVGDPSLFDPAAFRLVRTYAVVIVKLVTGGEEVLYGENQLYFENIPENNGAVGYVQYEFMPLIPGARSVTTPYQEVASGRDNEKFNADYGVSLGEVLVSGESKVVIDKTSDKAVVTPGGSIAYQISYSNAGTVAVGAYGLGLPLVVQDSVPLGTVYVAGSATNASTVPAGVSSYTVLYSTDDGATWTLTEPPAATVTDLQWWLNGQLEAGLAGLVGFSVGVPGGYTAPIVQNCAGLSYGDTAPFAYDCTTSLVQGSNTVSGTVFEDDGTGANFSNGVKDGDASEVGIPSVAVRLYADLNGNGVADSGDFLLAATNSLANGTYAFTALADGRYVVQVEPLDPDVPQYYALTTPAARAVDLDSARVIATGVSVTGQDFGFAPPLSLDKSGGATVYEGETVTYQIAVRNHLYSQGSSATTNLYWAPSNQVRTASLTLGTNSVISGNTGVSSGGWGVYADRTRNAIYWVDHNNDTIWSDDLDPATPAAATAWLTGLTDPGYIDIDHDAPGGRDYLWFSANNKLWRVDLADPTRTPQDRYTTGDPFGGGIAIDPANRWIYFQVTTATPAKTWIYRQNLDGAAGTRDTSWGVELGTKDVYDIAIDVASQMLYFVDGNNGYKFATVNIATQARTFPFDVSNGSYVRGVAVDVPNNTVYFSLNETGQIQRRNLTTGATLATLAGGTQPGDIDIEYGAGMGSYNVNTTVSTLTLKDEYPADKLAFVSASVPPDSTTPAGTLTWNNIGPLNGGDTATLSVTFRALAQAGNSVVSLLNTARVSYAVMENGREVNRPQDTAPTQILPAGSISGRIWADLDNDGWQPLTGTPSYGYETGEPGIGSVSVILEIDANNDGVADRTVTNRTDALGNYSFSALATNVRYRVVVDTATLPGTGITATGDPDDDVLNAGNGGTGSANNIWNNGGAGWFRIGVDSRRDATNTAQSWDVTNVNFGYFGTDPIIYGLVWIDLDRDGVRDPDEPGLSGATLTLSGAAAATVTTATNGTYRFLVTGTGAALPTGTYTNTLTLPTGPSWTYTFESATNSFGVTNTLSAYDGRLRFIVTGTSETSGSWDIGVIFDGTYTVGDTVYFDRNGNGAQEAGEAGIAGVDMRLYYDANNNGMLDATDFLWSSQTTGADGKYAFTNLANGRYFVVVDESDIPAGYAQTADPDQPGTVAVGGDGMGVAVVANANLLTVDFGYYRAGAGVIGDLVYRDANGNGSYQTGETGISNVTVRLYLDRDRNGSYESLLGWDETDTSGGYLFEGLADGPYRVEVLTSDTDLGSLVATTVTAYTLTLSNGVTTVFNGAATLIDRSRDADFGFAPRPSIGDFVYFDANRNGTQDPHEQGIPGVDLSLYTDPNGDGDPSDGVWVAAATTADGTGADPVGSYLFPELTPGVRYLVRVETNSLPLSGGVPLPQTADPDRDGVPCWDDSVPGLPPCDHQDHNILLSYSPYLGADFGYLPPGVIGDLLWIDSNTNGVLDAGERGIPYVSIVLYSGGTPIATNVTDADGYYSFANLADGTYRVVVNTNDTDFPAGLSAVYDADGTPDGVANAIIISGGHVSSIGGDDVTNADLTIDFGYRYTGTNSLSGTVGMDDPSYNGVLNGTSPSGTGAGEAPFRGVTLYAYLWDDDGDNVPESGETTLIASTQTDALGDYRFENLPEGDGDGDRYIVSLAAPVGDLKLTTETGDTTALWVRNTTNALGVTLSAYQVMAVAPARDNIDFAFRTATLRDYGDLPVTYSTVVADQPVGPSHTVIAGRDLWLGSGVTVEANGQPSATATGDGGEDGAVSVGRWQDGANGGTVAVTVGAGSGWLVGWIDFNRDGTFTNANERVISRAVSSTENGGLYTLTFPIPAGTFGTDGARILNARFRLYAEEPLLPLFSGAAAGGDVEDHQFVFGIIGNRVWEDVNGNGLQDMGETGVSNVTVRLYDEENALLETAVTSADGSYFFTGLPTNDYSVAFTQPDGTRFTLLRAGGDTALDSDAGTGGGSGTITLASNPDRRDLDAGLYVPAVLYGYIFTDRDESMVRDTGDTAITDLLVTLYANGVAVATTNSSQIGYYWFGNVPAGAVSVVVSRVGGILSGVPTEDPYASDVQRNRALPDAAGQVAYVTYTVLSGQGVLAARGAEPLNFGFVTKPLSAALDIALYATADGVAIELWTTDEEGVGDVVVYALIDGVWTEVGRLPAADLVGWGSNRYEIPAAHLEPGRSYELLVIDEVGNVHFSPGPVTVRVLRMEALRLVRDVAELAFATEPGRVYAVESSTDLRTWTAEAASVREADGWTGYTLQPFVAGLDGRTEVRVPKGGRLQAYFRVRLVE